ncbi:sensor histidine kinase [Cryptosporangium arvum]|uniref:histidine kinase n=1 Tax=Cryptosporangium arvum DSM 44712 TaxID=927661 RepID=A0A010ZR42_9ACTN|nr:nitrate- and nitrite sensing domain-containing protein [Cryptosporangium arvum]EXG79677.1 HAMP domain-containing protein,'ATPase, histidine kinase/DNA gyrase B/HSP90-like',nitrate and nitrite sensing family protein [Cryptosporangium arvum DSM 44712]
MFLDRLKISGKLVLLAIIPLLAVSVLALSVIVGRISDADNANDNSRDIQAAGEVATLVRELQAERLLTIGFLAGGFATKSEVLQQEAIVDDQIATVKESISDESPPTLVKAVGDLKQLVDLRKESLATNVPQTVVSQQLTGLINSLIDGLQLYRISDASTSIGRQILAMDSALHLGEQNSLNLATLTLLLATPNATLLSQYVSGLGTSSEYTNAYFQYANPTQATLYRLVQTANNARTSTELADLGTKADLGRVRELPLATYFPRFQSFLGQTRYIETKLVSDIVAATENQRRDAIAAAAGIGAALVLILGLVGVLTLLVGRRVSQPLVALASSANRIATAVETELTRVADDESEVFEPVRLDTVNTTGRDEIGELARAFEQVQDTAARLVERQITSRRNVATMFGHIGRRTQNLIGRQLSMIDRLERQETNTERLSSLYQLDHLSSRLNRNAGSLVVLSGSMATEQGGGTPLALGDIARLALGEIEDYTRVDIDVPEDIVVQPSVISDLTLIFAELMENATAYSPPHTRVTLSAEATRAGAQILIVDHGIGMASERLAEENARLARRERLDLAPTEVLGLFVTGRLARRHGISVALVPTSGGGVTAVLALIEQHLVPSIYQGIATVEEPPRALPAGPPMGQPEVLRVPNTAMPADPAATPSYAQPTGGFQQPAAVGYDQPQYGQPQYDQPQYGQPQYEQPRYDQPRYDQPNPAYEPAPVYEQPNPGYEPAANLPVVASNAMFDNVALERASRAISAGPWNAFSGNEAPVPGQREPVDVEPVGASAALYRSDAPPAQAPATDVSWWDNAPGARPTEPVQPAQPAAFRSLPAAPAQPAARPAPIAPAPPMPIPQPMAAPIPQPLSTSTTQPLPVRSAPVPAQPAAAGPPAGSTLPRLQRRVPGAQLPVGVNTAGKQAEPQILGDAGDPAAARALIEEFEAGVRNAQRAGDTGPVPQMAPPPSNGSNGSNGSHGYAPGPRPGSMSAQQATFGTPPPGPVHTPPPVAQPTWNSQQAAGHAAPSRHVPAAAPVSPPVLPQRPAPAGPPPQQQAQRTSGGLQRRVPGATLKSFTSGRGGASVTATPVADPDAARALIEQIEAGVSRALNRVVVDDHQHEGSPR